MVSYRYTIDLCHTTPHQGEDCENTLIFHNSLRQLCEVSARHDEAVSEPFLQHNPEG
jgi:hypothetical protein